MTEEERFMAKFDFNDDSVAVVIGSGAGGGTLANELCQKGVKVVLLEAGKRYSIEDLQNNEWPAFGQLSWLDEAQIPDSLDIG